MNLELLDPFGRQVPDRVDATIQLAPSLHFFTGTWKVIVADNCFDNDNNATCNENNDATTTTTTNNSNTNDSRCSKDNKIDKDKESSSAYQGKSRDEVTSSNKNTSDNNNSNSTIRNGNDTTKSKAISTEASSSPFTIPKKKKKGIGETSASSKTGSEAKDGGKKKDSTSKKSSTENTSSPSLASSKVTSTISNNKNKKKSKNKKVFEEDDGENLIDDDDRDDYDGEDDQDCEEDHEEEDDDDDYKAANCVAFNRRGTYLAVGHGSGTVAVHSVLSRTLVGLYHNPAFARKNTAINPKSGLPSTSATVSAAPIQQQHYGCTAVSWSRRSRTLLAGSYGDCFVKLIDASHPFGPDESCTGLLSSGGNNPSLPNNITSSNNINSTNIPNEENGGGITKKGNNTFHQSSPTNSSKINSNNEDYDDIHSSMIDGSSTSKSKKIHHEKPTKISISSRASASFHVDGIDNNSTGSNNNNNSNQHSHQTATKKKSKKTKNDRNEILPDHTFCQTIHTSFMDPNPRHIYTKDTLRIGAIVVPRNNNNPSYHGKHDQLNVSKTTAAQNDEQRINQQQKQKQERLWHKVSDPIESDVDECEVNPTTKSTKTVSLQKIYPIVTFDFPYPVGGSVQINPNRSTAGLAVLSNGSLVLFWIHPSVWIAEEIEEGSTEKQTTSSKISTIKQAEPMKKGYRCSQDNNNADSTDEGTTISDGKLIYDNDEHDLCLSEQKKRKKPKINVDIKPKLDVDNNNKNSTKNSTKKSKVLSSAPSSPSTNENEVTQEKRHVKKKKAKLKPTKKFHTPKAVIITLYERKSHSITAAAFDPHGDKVYAATNNGLVLGFDIGVLWHEIEKNISITTVPSVISHIINDNGKIMDCLKPKFMFSVPAGSSPPSCWHLLVSRNGKFVILNSSDGALRLYPTQPLWGKVTTSKSQSGKSNNTNINLNDKNENNHQDGGDWVTLHNYKPAYVFQDVVSKLKFASCDLSGDGEYAVGGANGIGDGNKYELFIWNTSTGALMDKLTGPASVTLYSVVWHPTRPLLAIATSDGIIDLWGPRINWTAFAPDFQALPMNVEYIEREDEFDVDPIDGKHYLANQDYENLNDIEEIENSITVDVTTIAPVPVFASDSENEDEVFVFGTKVKNLLSVIGNGSGGFTSNTIHNNNNLNNNTNTNGNN